MRADRTLRIYVNFYQNAEILILILTFIKPKRKSKPSKGHRHMRVHRMNEIFIIRISSLFGHKRVLSGYEVIQCLVIGTLRGDPHELRSFNALLPHF